MTIFKFKKHIRIHKALGRIRLDTTCYCSFENGKEREWTELRLWYDKDCEYCPCGWEDRSYEGECNDCGCYLSKSGDMFAPKIVCMLPDWLKRLLVKILYKVEDY